MNFLCHMNLLCHMNHFKLRYLRPQYKLTLKSLNIYLYTRITRVEAYLGIFLSSVHEAAFDHRK